LAIPTCTNRLRFSFHVIDLS